MPTTPQDIIIRASSEELLAVPSILLGFQPVESCVAMGFEGTRVRFCARLDLDWLGEGLCQVAAQLINARDNFEGCEFVLLGYSQDPAGAAEAMVDLLAVLASPVREVIVANRDRYWFVGLEGLEPERGIAWDRSQCSAIAEAVYHGLNVGGDRSDAVADVQPPSAADLREAEFHIEQSIDLVSGLSEAEQGAELARLLGSAVTLPVEDAAELVVLLADPVHMGEVMTQLSAASAGRIRFRLIEARRCADHQLEQNVVALLGLACWLDGEGAQLSDCLAQLDNMAPGHPVAGLLRRVHELAIPPSRWDE